MKLLPVVVLIEADDAETLRPTIARFAAHFEHDVPESTRDTMRVNGWTPEMLAWSIFFRGIAECVREGSLDFDEEVTTT